MENGASNGAVDLATAALEKERVSLGRWVAYVRLSGVGALFALSAYLGLARGLSDWRVNLGVFGGYFAAAVAVTLVHHLAASARPWKPAPGDRVYASGSLTGTYAKPGNYQHEGYKLCLKQVNDKGGLLGRLAGSLSPVKSRGIDLDLGCMFEMADGQRGLVQALGNAWGELDRAPFIKLDGDDRTGASTSGENLWINGDHFDRIRRAVIFSFIYEGVPNWAATDGVVTIAAPGQAPIEVRLDGGGREMMCAIALIENQGGNLQVTKLAEYFQGSAGVSAHEMMDRRFGFGLRWKTGRKD